MKVVHLSFSDSRGGAAIAAMRLHRSQVRQGLDSRVLAFEKCSSDERVVEMGGDTYERDTVLEFSSAQTIWIDQNRTEVSNTHFSLPIKGIDFSKHDAVRDADVIHLHWISSFSTPQSLSPVLSCGKPIIWTLHDVAPMTGGCHFPAGCKGFEGDCKNCIQIEDDPFRIPSRVLEEKRDLWVRDNLSLVCPSRWMAEMARKSRLFSSVADIHVIPNGLDRSVFCVSDAAVAKESLGISPEKICLLVGADSEEEKRKGFGLLPGILKQCQLPPNIALDRMVLLRVGGASSEPYRMGGAVLSEINLGEIRSETEMARVYAAADVFIFPSLEDNLPNMVIEAAACGTPTCAFNVGGLKDIVEDGKTGFLSSSGDLAGFAKSIAKLIGDDELRRAMGGAAAEKVEANFDDEKQAVCIEAAYRKSLESVNEVNAKTISQGEGAFSQIVPDLIDVAMRRELWFHRKEESKRLAVIEDLDREVQFLREECDKRLELVNRLERELAGFQEFSSIERDGNIVFRLLSKTRSLIRFNNWWFTKIPPFLVIGYLLALLGGVSVGESLTVLGSVFFSVICVASYGHVINDIFDIEEDRLAGKTNTMAGRSKLFRWGVSIGLVLLGFVPVLWMDWAGYWMLLLGINYLLPTLYSIPPVRLKERGIWGMLFDAGGAHITPALLIIAAFLQAEPERLGAEPVSVIAIAVWACVLGLKGILYHQIADWDHDAAASTKTWVRSFGKDRLKKMLPWYNLGIELPLSLLLVCLLLPSHWLPAVALSFYLTLEGLKCRSGFEFAINQDPLNNRRSVPFANDLFYECWLPVALGVELALSSPYWWWLPFVHVLLFFPNFRTLALDMNSVYKHCIRMA